MIPDPFAGATPDVRTGINWWNSLSKIQRQNLITDARISGRFASVSALWQDEKQRKISTPHGAG